MIWELNVEFAPSILQSSTMSVCLKLRISVTTKPIGLYSSGNIPTGPGMVSNYFIWGWDTPNLPNKTQNILLIFFAETQSQFCIVSLKLANPNEFLVVLDAQLIRGLVSYWRS